MSDNWRDILRVVLALVATLAVALTIAWLIVHLQHPDAAVGPLDYLYEGQP